MRYVALAHKPVRYGFGESQLGLECNARRTGADVPALCAHADDGHRGPELMPAAAYLMKRADRDFRQSDIVFRTLDKFLKEGHLRE